MCRAQRCELALGGCVGLFAAGDETEARMLGAREVFAQGEGGTWMTCHHQDDTGIQAEAESEVAQSCQTLQPQS